MQRKYKSELPENTVNRIRGIFAQLNLITYEYYWKNVQDKIYSCGILLEDTRYLKTLGKGMTKPYCLASGYGELMERIQNLILFTGNVGLSTEKILSLFLDTKKVKNYQQLLELNLEIKNKAGIEQVLDDLKMDRQADMNTEVIAAPYYDLLNNEVAYLPYSSILKSVRSNGMCAGNDFYEAIIEGFCELAERMAMQKIFYSRMVPPIVPREYLKQFSSYKIIEEIEQRGFIIEIRDCSMGKGYPVLALLIIHPESGRYRYNFGAHPDFNRALERCIGEICQVSGGAEAIDELFDPNLVIDYDMKQYDVSQDKHEGYDLEGNFYKALKNSNGILPVEFFFEEAEYSFRPMERFFHSLSYKEDVTIFLDLFRQDKKNVYIRDVSFLGFPTYYLYITECSVVQLDKSTLEFRKHWQQRGAKGKIIKNLYRLNKCCEEDTRDIIHYLEIVAQNSKYTNQEIENNWLEELMSVPVNRQNVISPEYMLAVLYFKLGEYNLAYESIQKHLQKAYLQKEEIYRATLFRQYMALRKKYDENKSKMVMERYAGHEIVQSFFSSGYIEGPDFNQLINNEECKKINKVFESIKKVLTVNQISQCNLSYWMD